MRNLKSIFICIAVVSSFIVSSCSCSNDKEEDNCTLNKVFPEIETVAKEHAERFAKRSLSEMQIQQRLFEVRAHEQDLRKENMNDEADYYIIMFKKHLKEINPDLANQIKK